MLPTDPLAPRTRRERRLATRHAGPLAARSAADEHFLSTLDARGVSYPDPGEAITSGHHVCTFLGQGGTTAGAARLALPRGVYDEGDAGTLVDVAVDAYCAGNARR